MCKLQSMEGEENISSRLMELMEQMKLMLAEASQTGKEESHNRWKISEKQFSLTTLNRISTTLSSGAIEYADCNRIRPLQQSHLLAMDGDP